MTAPLSIVIPTLNSADRIGPCLGALTAGVFDGLIREVILVDAASEDAIDRIAEITGAKLSISPKGRGAQLAHGATEAIGEWILFLHADTILQPGWIDRVRTHIDRHPDKAGYFDLSFDSEDQMAGLTAAWANWRSRLFALPYGDQALLISTQLYKEVGGHPAIPLMEDVALARALGRRRLLSLKTKVITSAARYQAEGWTNRGWRNLITLLRYRLGTPPEKLVACYEKR
ncbi:MAG: TIGR04283 family arsenosugar biosynthesis glycosyltransferase [Pseudomonadota bacterium]